MASSAEAIKPRLYASTNQMHTLPLPRANHTAQRVAMRARRRGPDMLDEHLKAPVSSVGLLVTRSSVPPCGIGDRGPARDCTRSRAACINGELPRAKLGSQPGRYGMERGGPPWRREMPRPVGGGSLWKGMEGLALA